MGPGLYFLKMPVNLVVGQWDFSTVGVSSIDPKSTILSLQTTEITLIYHAP